MISVLMNLEIYLSLDTGMLYESARIWCEATHSCSYVRVNLSNLLNAARFLYRTRKLIQADWVSEWTRTKALLSVPVHLFLTKRGEVTLFSTASITPSIVFTPMTVDPSCNAEETLDGDLIWCCQSVFAALLRLCS